MTERESMLDEDQDPERAAAVAIGKVENHNMSKVDLPRLHDDARSRSSQSEDLGSGSPGHGKDSGKHEYEGKDNKDGKGTGRSSRWAPY